MIEIIHEYSMTDIEYMKEALKEAKKASDIGEIPIGAIIVQNGKIISRGYNKKELKQDPTDHAEITAIKKACKRLASWRLNGCDMYVTLEPCSMCAGAIIQARIDRLFIGTKDPKAGAAGSVIDIFGVDSFNHKTVVHYGLLEDNCSQILKDFFKVLRTKKQYGKL